MYLFHFLFEVYKLIFQLQWIFQVFFFFHYNLFSQKIFFSRSSISLIIQNEKSAIIFDMKNLLTRMNLTHPWTHILNFLLVYFKCIRIYWGNLLITYSSSSETRVGEVDIELQIKRSLFPQVWPKTTFKISKQMWVSWYE